MHLNKTKTGCVVFVHDSHVAFTVQTKLCVICRYLWRCDKVINKYQCNVSSLCGDDERRPFHESTNLAKQANSSNWGSCVTWNETAV